MGFSEEMKSVVANKTVSCPLRGQWVSFSLVDECGSGKPYGGLTYKVIDSVGQQYSGTLDSDGFAKLDSCYKGPVSLTIDEPHDSSIPHYYNLMTRQFYPLPITELQVRAEETHFFQQSGFRVEHNPARSEADDFFQVEVRDLVKDGAHLPPVVKRFNPPRAAAKRAMSELTFDHGASSFSGVCIMPNKHTVLEVRPMRALRPILSTDNEFCALNLYQLALMSTMVYNPFGQQPESRPEAKVTFPVDPSFGNLFGELLSNYREAWCMDSSQTSRFYPLYEDVAYSKRFEILPFNPDIYDQNKLIHEDGQEHPGNQHFFSDPDFLGGTNTQAFITHHDEIVLISVRGTQEFADILRDLDALQLPFEEGKGTAHQGFYKAYKAMKKFVQNYLDRYHSNQKIIICGHSLGGAICTLLAEALRRDKRDYNVLLYTYGSPRAGDSVFVEGANELVHHRIVNNNDPVPSVPAPWMNADWRLWVPGAVLGGTGGGLLFAAGMFRLDGDPYMHQGTQRHFMPVVFRNGEKSSVLWDPGCESIEAAGLCKLAHEQDKQFHGNDMPDRGMLLKQIQEADDHKMLVSYIPFTWSTLRRWQETEKANQTIVTDREYRFVEQSIEALSNELQKEEAKVRRSVNFRNEGPDQSHIVHRLAREIDRLQVTLGRLRKLNATKLEIVDIYGNATLSPDFESSLKRWMAHTENVAQVQLAMIPSEPDDVYIAGVYQDRKSDSFV
ncbi:lipase family protein [Pseudomonas sp. CCI3.2]|uniref:lipase family protein n=1 Tax=unclassified Pseudomonas TaxID=196821 RepID=UPI002AC913D7|nr:MULTISPECIES: lipase family protein [unclassified Pseudomonas]MEB0079631.1 lipase family protein [Pseudomonas sp. MH10out]MEB0103837.1 lipase family protein [Pseudomonas sp. CCI3.2]MEB0133087.1 lipase family protein [Pseudomonas sp. CCI2.4]MEB0157812.1 lipase family protein [Pseudomonas sp. AH2 (2023)]MEB0169341.1 lipase family protein [Pseudomonas sp. CCC4.4]